MYYLTDNDLFVIDPVDAPKYRVVATFLYFRVIFLNSFGKWNSVCLIEIRGVFGNVLHIYTIFANAKKENEI